MLKGRYQNLITEIQKCKPRTIVEVGTWNGRHAAAMINEAQKYQKELVKYYGYDLFEDFSSSADEFCPKKPASRNEVVNYLNKNATGYWELIQGDTWETLWDSQPKEPIDFVFLDGGHSISTIENDWLAVREMIHSESIILFDDYYKDKELSKTVGCRQLIMRLSKEGWKTEKLKPMDKPLGGISIIKVTR